MKKMRLFALLGSLCLVLILVACAAPAPAPAPIAPTPGPTPSPVPGPAAPAPAPKVIKLKAVIFLPVPQVVKPMNILIDKVNKMSKGELVIEFLGAQEVIAGVDQPEAISKGVIDMGAIPGTYASTLVPAIKAIQMLKGTPQELRARGWYEVVNEMMAKVNLYELGGADYGNDRLLWTSVPVRTIEDIDGLKLRAIGTDLNFAKALGASTITVSLPETYTSMERGLIQGFFMASPTTFTRKIYKVSNYCLDHSLFSGMDLSFWINRDTFHRLPAHLQKILQDAMIETEKEFTPIMAETMAKARAEMDAAGIEWVTFPPEEAARYLSLFHDINWKIIIEENPEFGPRLREAAGS